MNTNNIKIGIAGLGTIGQKVAREFASGIRGMSLEAVSSGNADKAKKTLSDLGFDLPVVSAAELAARCDVVVECAPSHAFASIAVPALERGKILLTVSGAALLENPHCVETAITHNGQIRLATGALLGLDAVRAAAESRIFSVRMVTRKPPKSLIKAKHVLENGIDLSELTEPLKLFSGTSREGAAAFPANVNVAAALGLAAGDPNLIELEIWADPELEHNTHRIFVDSDSALLELFIQNIPSDENPGTGKITALSVVAALRSLTTPVYIGT